jgi:L-serine dehydratase
VLSVFDLFTIGIGPSSSHTVGPMRAARDFVERLSDSGRLTAVHSVTTHLYGSLAATGHGHGTVGAIILGLLGNAPETVDPVAGAREVERVRDGGSLSLGGLHSVSLAPTDIRLHLGERLDFHSNGLRFEARDVRGAIIEQREYFSVGGGFIVDGDEALRISAGELPPPESAAPNRFADAGELLALAASRGLSISELILENELTLRNPEQVRAGVLEIWAAMRGCIEAGCSVEGELPGGLHVQRRAAEQRARLQRDEDLADPLRAMEWVTMAALAVNEQNAAGGRVVTAPTNGAAGIIPAVLDYYVRFVPGADDDGVVRFLLAAAGIGTLFKQNASISGAEVGCQGEVGSASSMAAAGLAEVLGGTPAQVEYAAEIGLEHNLGLTCDPVGGLVQIPCIERNAIGAIKAITAARMALRSSGVHLVSLDDAIETMRRTGADMHSKYKETAQGGLALTLAAVEC